MRALLILFILGAVPALAQAEPRQVLGYAGALGEWELTATVDEKKHWWSKEFSGPVSTVDCEPKFWHDRSVPCTAPTRSRPRCAKPPS